jgi:hypothetical protein
VSESPALPPRKRVLNVTRLLARLTPTARIALATGNPLTRPRTDGSEDAEAARD